MNLKETKQKMLEYTDFYGGQLLDYDKIKGCKSKKELKVIIDDHHDHLEAQCNDAQHNLDSFQREIKLTSLDI